MIKLPWSEFKSLADQGKVSITYIEKDLEYLLYIMTGGMVFHSVIFKNGEGDVLSFELSYKLLGNKGNGVVSSSFAQKTFNGKSLFKRIIGISSPVIIGENIIDYIVPYDFSKITGVEIIGAVNGDSVDFEVYDTPTGLISGYPNVKINQFGFGVMVSKDYYAHRSEFDSDLYKNLKLRVKYHSTIEGNIGINFIINEVK